MSENIRQSHIEDRGRNSFYSLHELPGPTGLSLHRFFFLRDPVAQTLPWMNHGKVARDADTMMTEADAMASEACNSLHDEHAQRAQYFKEGKIHKSSLKKTVLVERHDEGVLTQHRQQSWYTPGSGDREPGY